VYEGPRNREYPMPPLRSTGFTDHMAAAAKTARLETVSAPAAINSEAASRPRGYVFHGYCGRGGCHISAKNSTAVTTIPEAMKTKI
jgi:gluconate 2-dehydrogenase alpha chain